MFGRDKKDESQKDPVEELVEINRAMLALIREEYVRKYGTGSAEKVLRERGALY